MTCHRLPRGHHRKPSQAVLILIVAAGECCYDTEMSPGRESRPRYDERYKTLFAFPCMVEDLLRAFFSGRRSGCGKAARKDLNTNERCCAVWQRCGLGRRPASVRRL